MVARLDQVVERLEVIAQSREPAHELDVDAVLGQGHERLHRRGRVLLRLELVEQIEAGVRERQARLLLGRRTADAALLELVAEAGVEGQLEHAGALAIGNAAVALEGSGGAMQPELDRGRVRSEVRGRESLEPDQRDPGPPLLVTPFCLSFRPSWTSALPGAASRVHCPRSPDSAATEAPGAPRKVQPIPRRSRTRAAPGGAWCFDGSCMIGLRIGGAAGRNAPRPRVSGAWIRRVRPGLEPVSTLTA